MKLRKIRRGNKIGSFNLDMLFIILALFLFVVGVIIVNVVMGKLTAITTPDNDAIAEFAKDDINQFEQDYANYADVTFLLVFAVLVIGLWFTSWIIDTHPVFFVVALVLNVIFTILAMYFQNTYEGLFIDSSLTASASDFIIIPFIMSNFVPVILGVAFVTTIILFAKLRST